MRDSFQTELDELGAGLAGMCGLAGDAMDQAVRALVTVDLQLAEQVISEDEALDAARAACAERAYHLLSLQAPVTRDLRLVVTGIRAAEKLERMGDLARHVAELVRRRHPAPVLPEEMIEPFTRMGELSVGLARSLQSSISDPNTVQYAEREQDDDEIDALQRRLLTAAVQRGDGPEAVRLGIDVALLTRFVERFADQAVAAARRLDYIVTGSVPDKTTP